VASKPSPAQHRHRKRNKRAPEPPTPPPAALIASPSTDKAAVSDIEVVELARRFRRESIATLISVSRNERAPASARAMAARTLLEYSDGKPGQAQRITVADLPSMTADQRNELLSALLFQYETELPGEFKQLMQQITDEAVERLMHRQAAATPPRLPLQQPPQPVRADSPEPEALPEAIVATGNDEPEALPDNVVPPQPPLPRRLSPGHSIDRGSACGTHALYHQHCAMLERRRPPQRSAAEHGV
jgi:hypothetical protein